MRIISKLIPIYVMLTFVVTTIIYSGTNRFAGWYMFQFVNYYMGNSVFSVYVVVYSQM